MMPLECANPGSDRRAVRDRGASLVEYCLLMALVTLVVIGGLTAFGSARNEMFSRSSSSIVGAP